MSTRTRTTNPHLYDSVDPDRCLTIIPGRAGLTFLATDRDTDQRAEVYLDPAGLDQLMVEIQRLRDQRGI